MIGCIIGYTLAEHFTIIHMSGVLNDISGKTLSGVDQRIQRPGRRFSVHDCKRCDLKKIADPRGNLTFIEGGRDIPFQISRVYYLYDVPGGAERGGHAHKQLEQLIVAMSGSFDVVLDDGYEKLRIHMNRPYYGLYIPRMIWRELDNFSSGSVCMVLASNYFDESDYFRDHVEYLIALRAAHSEAAGA